MQHYTDYLDITSQEESEKEEGRAVGGSSSHPRRDRRKRTHGRGRKREEEEKGAEMAEKEKKRANPVVNQGFLPHCEPREKRPKKREMRERGK